MDKKRIILVTGGFPFGDTERGFLSEEFRQLCQAFSLHIISVGTRQELVHPLPDQVTVERFFYPPFGKSVAGLCAVAGSLLEPEVRKELAAALKDQKMAGALARAKQILAFWVNAKSMARRMEELVAAEHTDLIYTYWCTEATLAALMLKQRYPGMKVITRFHGHDLFNERRPTGLQPFRRLIGFRVDQLVFAYQEGAEYYLSHWGEELRSKVRISYLGCPQADRTPRESRDVLRLVSCSNLIELKRVERIVDSISLLPEEIPVQWDHFGDGPLRAQMEKRSAEKLGSNVRWKFHGRIPNHAIADTYRMLDPDLFVTASSTEGGVPVSIQEAFSMGIPVVGTDVGGIADAIEDGDNGFLISGEGKAEDLRDAILRYVCSDGATRSKMSQAAWRTWAERFDARKNGAQFVSELRKLLPGEKSET